MTRRARPEWALPGAVLGLTLVQLLLGTLTGWPQYDGKAFGWRLVFYPLLMAAVPVLWWAGHRRTPFRIPWAVVGVIWTVFLLDVSGNTADLFDTLPWWDDLMHLVNWGLLSGGAGLLLPRIEPPRLLVLTVAGMGALLAVGWEVGEWFTFIRAGVELHGAYEDTLGDLVLGTLGAIVAGLVLARLPERSWPSDGRVDSTREP